MRAPSVFVVAATSALVSIAAFSAIGAARAEPQTGEDAFVERLYAGTPGKTKTYACFVRKYDARHLAQHPRQKVTAMKLLVTAEWIPEDTQLNHSFDLALRYRNRRGVFDSGGSCGHADPEAAADSKEPGLSCSVDCDGGGMGIVLTNNDQSVTLHVSRLRIWRGKDPDEAASESLAGPDDSVFRLDRADISECRSLIRDNAETTAMLSR
jgi:hypothetical protein